MKKEFVIESLRNVLNVQLVELQSSIKSVNESIKGEGKSTAGDKYETARAMNHIELDRLNSSYQKKLKSGSVLNALSISETHKTVGLGSLVTTSKRTLFFCGAIGKIQIQDTDVLTMSMGSPIGQLYLGKTLGDSIQFNNATEVIEEIQ
ncbi:MAG: transcription elongation GreA/GreB family factor [Bacteroidia bacterium]|jgi:transcription elongation GreA/GreB family factor